MSEQSKPLVLIVDDEPKSVQFLGNLLRLRGYRISYATSGEKALSILNVISPDIILLDVILPDFNGFELCKKIKDTKNLKSIPVLFLTAQSELKDKVNGFQVGGVDYITKPYEEEEIIVRLNTHLQLKKAKEDLETLNATKDKFFSIIAHDLRNPFSSISGFTQLMKTDYEDLSQDEIKLFINEINKTSRNTNELLEKLLSWANIQTNKIKYSPTQINLKETVHNAALIYESEIKLKKINLLISVENDILISNDPNLLETAIRNVISNAINFSENNSKIEIYAKIKNDSVDLFIKDYGIGLSEEDLKKLFKIEINSAQIGLNKNKGNGLGLIITKELLELCNCSIDVTSKIKHGTIVSIHIPRFN